MYKISDLTHSDAIERELVLFKVQAPPERRHEIIEIADIFRSYGIKQLTRTGKIAMSRGAHDQ